MSHKETKSSTSSISPPNTLDRWLTRGSALKVQKAGSASEPTSSCNNPNGTRPAKNHDCSGSPGSTAQQGGGVETESLSDKRKHAQKNLGLSPTRKHSTNRRPSPGPSKTFKKRPREAAPTKSPATSPTRPRAASLSSTGAAVATSQMSMGSAPGKVGSQSSSEVRGVMVTATTATQQPAKRSRGRSRKSAVGRPKVPSGQATSPETRVRTPSPRRTGSRENEAGVAGGCKDGPAMNGEENSAPADHEKDGQRAALPDSPSRDKGGIGAIQPWAADGTSGGTGGRVVGRLSAGNGGADDATGG
ncbi:unnamed protein product, partial [Discosporangium mesarthrocarpum]